MASISRRDTLKSLAAATTAGTALGQNAPIPPDSDDTPPVYQSGWAGTRDRRWIDGDVWANPMEDWRIEGGRAVCESSRGRRTLHLTSHRVTDPAAGLTMRVKVTRLQAGKPGRDCVGFLLGVQSELGDTQSNTFTMGGVVVGYGNGQLHIGNQTKKLPGDQPINPLELVVSVRSVEDGCLVHLSLNYPGGEGHPGGEGSFEKVLPASRLIGNVALTCNFDQAPGSGGGSTFAFSDWNVSGKAMTATGDELGMILWTMYTVDQRGDSATLRLQAMMPPVGPGDNQTVMLELQGDAASTHRGMIEPDSGTALFVIEDWDARRAVPYVVTYEEFHLYGEPTKHRYSGTIATAPADRPFKLAALTCQKDYAFPYKPVRDNLLKLEPDLVYFSGDQLYEDHGGYGLVREPAEAAIENYKRKFYMFGWAFRDVMRDRPTICIPDDHDVFQGNYWGEGGAAMEVGPGDGGASSRGGYREPVRMVNAVHKTCAGHHPPPVAPDACVRGMSTYFGELKYGGVHFAILADRQFKSGPEKVDTGRGRADHVLDPDVELMSLDQPGLELLGKEQEAFLERFAGDDSPIKVVLSQTVLAGVATHHGGYDSYLRADLDSGGWPQTPRNRAVALLRDAKALHINGDQHLTTLVQYGIDQPRDAGWSFCVPAIAAGYPRWWRPDEMGMEHTDRPEHGLPNTGQYLDAFGNLAYVYAVGNPQVGKAPNRYDQAHEKGSGLGWVLIDPEARTYEIHAYKFLSDPTDSSADNEFPGWPLTLTVADNAGGNVGGNGFVSLFDGETLDGWIGAVDDYQVVDGAIQCRQGRGGNLLTEKEYGDFEVRLQFKLPPAGNNGLAIRSPIGGNAAYNAMTELQVLDTEHPKYKNIDPRQRHGSAYGMVAAELGHLKPTGRWNDQTVRVVGSTIRVTLNGHVILDCDLDDVTEFMADSPHPGKDRTRGHFGFAGHNDPVQFRGIEIREVQNQGA